MNVDKIWKQVKRKFAIVGLALGFSVPVLGAGVLAYCKIERHNDCVAHEQVYGTKKNPMHEAVIKIKENRPLGDFATQYLPRIELENRELEKSLENVDYNLLILEAINNETLQLQDRLDKINPKQDNPETLNNKESLSNLSNLGLSIDEFVEIYSAFNDPLKNTLFQKDSVQYEYMRLYAAFKSFEKSDDYSGNFIKDGMELIEKITGKEIPEIKITLLDKIEDAPESVAGQYFSGRNEIVLEKYSPLLMLIHLLHEYGHAFSQQNEDYYFHHANANMLLTENQDKKTMTRILEEASAYAFERLAGFAVDDDELSEKINLYMKLEVYAQLRVYSEDNKNIHPIALLISDATLTYFKDPVKAFNYLSTVDADNFEQGISDIVQKNISACKKNQDLRSRLLENWVNAIKMHSQLSDIYNDLIDYNNDSGQRMDMMLKLMKVF